VSGEDDYCRAIESYLCRKNDGHLIRLVGPSFERVCAWADRGVPLKVVYRGIDRYAERYYAKGPRRRPVRIEFCEADVLDVFDEWRRAVGVTVVREARADAGAGDPNDAAAGGGDAEEGAGRGRGSLPAHLDRAIGRLTARLEEGDQPLTGMLQETAHELEEMRGHSKALRGSARQAALARLRVLDTTLVSAARASVDGAALTEIALEAEGELAPFRDRMPGDAYERARAACIDRIVRARARLPTLVFD
jgi:hypothetical protein